MKTIFTVALFALLSVGSACSKKNDAQPSSNLAANLVGMWTGTFAADGVQGGGVFNPTIDYGQVSWNGKKGTWNLVDQDITLDLSVSSQIIFKGTIQSTSPYKLTGTWASTSSAATGTWEATKN
jgi:hypothetical protein